MTERWREYLIDAGVPKAAGVVVLARKKPDKKMKGRYFNKDFDSDGVFVGRVAKTDKWPAEGGIAHGYFVKYAPQAGVADRGQRAFDFGAV